MPTTLFITQTEIAKYTPMGGNVDTDKYIYLVKDSQIMHVEPVLGTKLYNKLQTDFTNGTITGIYNTIVEDYIKPILIHMVFAEYVAIGAYRVQNGGLFKHLPEDGESMSLSEIESLEKNQRAKASFYIDRLLTFLCDQDGNIPEYTYAQDNDYDQKPNQSNNYYGGWFLGQERVDNWMIDENNHNND